MPVRSLRSSVLRWPDGGAVREAARRWALDLLAVRPEVQRAGYFGSYATGREGVGSDLDLVVVLDASGETFERRGLLFDCSTLPVPCDLLVYTRDEFAALLSRGGRFAEELTSRAVWFARPL
ncbi:MAG: nucleotidyltransferase domain-containing protein [Planctomycetes bacterium]|jgi:predicted nucleotidyltransferase|nr:nucleotidyltransferase domain-containing protein [Planctomycetota bacterium]